MHCLQMHCSVIRFESLPALMHMFEPCVMSTMINSDILSKVQFDFIWLADEWSVFLDVIPHTSNIHSIYTHAE